MTPKAAPGQTASGWPHPLAKFAAIPPATATCLPPLPLLHHSSFATQQLLCAALPFSLLAACCQSSPPAIIDETSSPAHCASSAVRRACPLDIPVNWTRHHRPLDYLVLPSPGFLLPTTSTTTTTRPPSVLPHSSQADVVCVTYIHLPSSLPAAPFFLLTIFSVGPLFFLGLHHVEKGHRP